MNLWPPGTEIVCARGSSEYPERVPAVYVGPSVDARFHFVRVDGVTLRVHDLQLSAPAFSPVSNQAFPKGRWTS